MSVLPVLVFIEKSQLIPFVEAGGNRAFGQ
jgi:hypothetical protein